MQALVNDDVTHKGDRFFYANAQELALVMELDDLNAVVASEGN